MVVQRESVDEDEDVEHFEDAKEEDDIDSAKEAEKEEKDIKVVHVGGKITSKDGDSSSDDEEALVAKQSDEEEDDYASDIGEELFIKETPRELKQTMEVSNDKEKTSQQPLKSSRLPGGYDPRHREPSYCNGDRASWWELMVLSTHVHPSVATMAGTLLSGANIVYNGNPLNDLSLTAFLDKFMEKKAKQSTWHGGSQIEPSKKLDMTNRVIGSEILKLAEEDVAPEDLVFHKFYVNKMNSTKQTKKKKKKKLPEEEDAEELYDVADGDGGGNDGSDVEFGDESDNEEIENMLDEVDDDAVEELGGEYDYDDLDKVVGDDDEELVGNASDAEMDTDMDMDMLDGEDIDDDVDEDGSYGDEGSGKKKKKEQRKRKSPFASLEEYEHLIDQDEKDDSISERKVTSEPKKKKKKKTTKASE